MIKTLLVLSGTAFLALPALHAQDREGRSQGPSGRSQIMGDRAARSAPSALPSSQSSVMRSTSSPSAVRSRLLGDRAVRPSSFRTFPRFSDGRGHDEHRGGRYYYLSGVPYFYPSFGYGFGYPSYYYNDYSGPGYYGDYYGEPYPPGYYESADRPYEGRIVQETAPGKIPALKGARSLPAAVQRQLAERGFYNGSIDGQFGPASKSALRRFQREHHLKETGLIDEASLKALGFRAQ